MSLSEQKSGWLRNWRAAQRKFSAFVASGDRESAAMWCGVALAIELRFADFFGERFGDFLAASL